MRNPSTIRRVVKFAWTDEQKEDTCNAALNAAAIIMWLQQHWVGLMSTRRLFSRRDFQPLTPSTTPANDFICTFIWKYAMILLLTVVKRKAFANFFYVVYHPECTKCESRDLENPSTIHVTVSTGQVTVWLEHRLVQVNHSLQLA